MIPFLCDNDALRYADQHACGPFSVLITSVVTGRFVIGRTLASMKLAGEPRDWFVWGYRIHDRLIPGREL